MHCLFCYNCYFFSFRPNKVGDLSEQMFALLCHKVGTSDVVAIRREIKDIREIVERLLHDNNDVIYMHMVSGSMREGFRLDGSDLDMMSWPVNHRTIWNMSQSEHYSTTNKTLILSDSSESPPGFALLELLKPTTDKNIKSAGITLNDNIYISSSLYRRRTCSQIFPNSTEHGPCGSGKVFGIDYDIAQSFACDCWPPSAYQWMDRCESCLDFRVVYDIVRNGCHFVPIGNSLSNYVNEEWRISFSLAEQKMVYSMNHCQFLTYGLLKIFLKKVINQQKMKTDNLLCSYHIKTVILWAIQQNTTMHICPQNLLEFFWICFKLLIKWVYEGVCPNFFIPQNNLFMSKIHGSAQRNLFLRLHSLYERGLACLLESRYFWPYFSCMQYNRRISTFTVGIELKTEVDYLEEIFYEMHRIDSRFPKDLRYCIKFLQTVERFFRSHLTPHQVLVLQKFTANIIQRTVFIINNRFKCPNKQRYIADRMSCHMLKVAVKYGCISDIVYIAIYYYKTSRYQKALSIIQNTKDKIRHYLLYERYGKQSAYLGEEGKPSIPSKMKQTIAENIELYNNILYIPELTLEQQASGQSRWPMLHIPLFVMIDFIEFLCYKHIYAPCAQRALWGLHELVQGDPGLYLCDLYKDISWEILGICHQIAGNLQPALYSFNMSLIQNSSNRIQNATNMRIRNILGRAPHLSMYNDQTRRNSL